MAYSIILRRCTEKEKAIQIAREIAAWSGIKSETVYSAITSRDICLQKGLDASAAAELKNRFQLVNVVVELIDQPPVQGQASHDSDDDEEEDLPGRILSEKELTEQFNVRSDIFHTEKDGRLHKIESVTMFVAIVAGIWLSTREIIAVVAPDFLDGGMKKLSINTRREIERPKPPEKAVAKVVNRQSDIKVLKPTKRVGESKSPGGGDPRSRITRIGLMGIVSGAVNGKNIASADLFAKGGVARDIDAILAGVNGLAQGSGGVGRRGPAGIGYSEGFNSGMGGGPGEIGDLMAGEYRTLDLTMKDRGSLTISAPQFVSDGVLVGGRSRASIIRVVMQNLAALRYAYNQRLREKPGLKGRITVKFAIDEFGKVIFCQTVNSTMADPMLESVVIEKITRWAFEKIDKPGDVTEVVYPFVFAQ